MAGKNGTVYTFTGEEFDATSNLIYLRARYYHPHLKAFLSHDPFPGFVSVPASQHGYSYVHNNPINHTDPTGEVLPALIIGGVLYGIGYLVYDYLVPKNIDPSTDLSSLLTYGLGLFLGYENIRHDLNILRDSCTSFWRKFWAAGDAVFNAALGISMYGGFVNSVKAIPRAKRLIQAGSATTNFGRVGIRIGKHGFYRPLGSRVIQVPSSAGGRRLVGGVAHEFAHAQQEFAVGSRFAQHATKPLQRLSAHTTKTFGNYGALFPTYVLNPIEIHAAASGGVGNIGNFSLLLVSRTEAWAVTYGIPERIFQEE